MMPDLGVIIDISLKQAIYQLYIQSCITVVVVI